MALYQLSYRGGRTDNGLQILWRPVRESNPRLRPGQGRTLATELTDLQTNGGGDRNRTRDLLLARQTLYQLSYTPNEHWRNVPDSNRGPRSMRSSRLAGEPLQPLGQRSSIHPVTSSGATQSLWPVSAPRGRNAAGALGLVARAGFEPAISGV